VLYDSFYVVGGRTNNEAMFQQNMIHFINDAYRHYKPIGVATTGQPYLQATEGNNLAGVVFAKNNPNFATEFVNAIAQQRFWDRT